MERVRSRWSKAALVALVVLVAFISIAAFIPYALTRFASVAQHAVPGVGDTLSTSMEPFAAELRTALSARDLAEPDAGAGAVRVWKVELPRAFVLSESQDGDGEYQQSGLGGHSIRLYAALDNFSASFFPASLIQISKNEDMKYFITLTNEFYYYYPSICLRDMDIKTNYPQPKSMCDPDDRRFVRCTVIMNYMGRRVDIQMPKKSYFGDYLKACRTSHDFLEKITKTIEHMPLHAGQ